MKVIVVGGGASGLMAAGFAAGNGHEVTVIERNPRMARKVLLTGNGRCNVTNNCSVQTCIDHIPSGGRFLYSALTAFTPQDTMALLEQQGVPLKTEPGNRVFPVSDKAIDVVDGLVRFARAAGVAFRQGRVTNLILQDGACRGVFLEDGTRLEARAVAICTGGLSYPATGSTGDGYRLARQAGHTIVPTRPSLVPLICQEEYCRRLQGLALKNCRLTVRDTATGKELYTGSGDMLFTHFGVSGPVVLNASAHMREMQPGRYRLAFDIFPALSPDQLEARILRELEQAKNRHFGNMLGALLPRLLVPVAAQLAGIPAEKPCHDITKAERRRLVALLKAFPVTVAGFRPIEEAMVTAGGVSLKEVDARTMASKLVQGLYFAGEVLDIDAYTGGFNLQAAFATGAAAGRHM